MSEGELVTVRLYGGGTAVRRVLSIWKDVVVICSEDEFAAAQEEGREPMSLAFPKADVVDARHHASKKGPGSITPRAGVGSMAGD